MKPNINRFKANKISAIDLFCGAGGLTKGLELSNISVKVGVDLDPSCRFPYEKNTNAEFLEESISNVQSATLKSYIDKDTIFLLAGCAPCQTFSTYNQKASSQDDRWWLLLEFARLLVELKPQLVTMENVPGIIDQEVFNQFLDVLDRMNYKYSFSVVNCEEYGIPQHRRRLVLLASQFAPIKILSPNEFGAQQITTKMAISHLPPLAAGSQDQKDPLHRASSLSDLNLRRIRASKPGGSWRDWDPSILSTCHRKKTGKTYSSVYGRMSWDQPSPTITTQFYGFGNGRFGHPEQDRALSLREGALLQTFPPEYLFVDSNELVPFKKIGRMIGNAVPVQLGVVIGKSIQKHIHLIKSK